MVLAGPELARVSGAGAPSRRHRWARPAAAAACALSFALLLAGLAMRRPGVLLDWYDLHVYEHAGLIARTFPARLYSWQLRPGIKFTYTPFAALLFAVSSLLPWAGLKWLMTGASLAALPATVWFTLGALGWRAQSRVTAWLALTAGTLWIEPVQRALHLGQVELLLMALIVWDLCQPDGRKWKGAGVGLAAGIKLVPLIFIPYLVLAGKLRQAAVALAVFIASALVGFAFLPRASVKWWLTGYFLHPGNVGDVGSLLNQSLFAMLARGSGSMDAATPAWLGLAAVTAALGLASAAVLHRRGHAVAGWLTCAVTGLLVSPISWDHHWVWMVVALVLFTGTALRSRGVLRWAGWALAAVVAGAFGDWPEHWAGPLAFDPQGLLGFFIGPHAELEKYHLHGLQEIAWNLYVLAGLALLAAAAAAAAAAARGQTARGQRERPAPS